MLSVGSLFSGIAGIELGLERTGKFRTKWFCETDPYACAVLRKNFPTVPNIGNIKTVKWDEVERVDVLTGGFPCQPFSVAGKRRGEKDERALWSYFLEAIRQVKPKWVLAENVPGLLSVDSGRAFRNILASIAEAGLDAEWFTLRASDFGAPHRRERLFIVAYPNKQRRNYGRNMDGKYKRECVCNEVKNDTTNDTNGKQEFRDYKNFKVLSGTASDTSGYGGFQESECISSEDFQKGHSIQLQERAEKARVVADDWGERIQRFNEKLLEGSQGFAWAKDVRRVEDFFGKPDVAEPLIRRENYGIPRRLYNDRIRCLGNSVVPQVAQFIGEAIAESEERMSEVVLE